MEKMRKCDNCAEWVKTCQPTKKYVCRLMMPMLWQLLDARKVQGLFTALHKLGMRLEPVGKDDFTVVLLQGQST
jgi:hypothetical protein